jgi:hypothetical protein
MVAALVVSLGGVPVLSDAQPSTEDAGRALATRPVAGPLIMRLFLKDGSAIAALGEFARVGDRVIFSVPLTATRQPLASVSAAEVDWTRTDRYSHSVRAERYAATRGELDYARMTALVARMLSDIAITPGATAQLELAERARRILAAWPKEHYGYRAAETRETLALLDEVMAGLRASSGQTSFAVSLVAEPPPSAPPETLIEAPSLQESIEHVLRLANLAPSSSERVALYEQAAAALSENISSLPAGWAQAARSRANAALAVERKTRAAYSSLFTSAMNAIDRAMTRADVRRVASVRARVLEKDRALGQKRPDEVRALLATIDLKIDAARRLRLARDQFAAKAPAVRRYRTAVEPWTRLLTQSATLLADIRGLAGPPVERLTDFLRRLDTLTPLMRTVIVPVELQTAHGSLLSALQLAETAVRYRQRAIAANDMKLAWDASAAAAGSLLMLERSKRDVVRALEPPQGK